MPRVRKGGLRRSQMIPGRRGFEVTVKNHKTRQEVISHGGGCLFS